MSFSSYVFVALRIVLSLLLGAVGTLCILSVAGVFPLPPQLRFSDKNGVDKWAAGAALLGAPAPQFTAALGACKLIAAAGMWAGRSAERLVTVLAFAMYCCVAAGHYKIDGDFAPPLFPAAFCLLKLLLAPPAPKAQKSARSTI